MIKIDEDALYCDFAETYHILDFRKLEADQAARLAAGLRGNSRIRAKAGGLDQTLDTYLSGLQVDLLRGISWGLSDSKKKSKNPPEPIVANFVIKKKAEVRSFSSIDELRAARKRILGVGK